MPTVEQLAAATQRIRDSAHAVGAALSAVSVYAEPTITRAVQAEQNLYRGIETEFSLLSSTDAGRLMGSRSSAPRNLAAAAHRGQALIGLRRGNQVVYPGFQFGSDGQPLPVIKRLREIADANGWSETALLQWLCAPTTYLDGDRPVDHLGTDPERVAAVAADDFSVSW